MRPSLGSPATRVVFGLAFALLVAIGFAPLFGGPGYEAALAAGVVLPPLAAVATALDVRARREGPFDAFRRGLVTGAALAALGLAVTWFHGIRVGFCDALEGSELYALGPGAGSVMGGAWGAVAGLVTTRRSGTRRFAIALSFAGPLAGIAVSVMRFYTSPMVFAFDPFFGFFAGTLYDSVITGLGRLATYRVGSLATLVAFGSACFYRELPGERRGALALAVLATALSALHGLRGPSLGHYQLTSTIVATLGKKLEEGRCVLVYPSATPDLEAHALVHECDGHVRQLERFFGVPGPERVTAFLFASADQKGYLTGASGTYIAKPWRREIYVQRAGYPHPVMRHELAHVMAGAFGVGPFRVAGPLAGIVPDPGRIEGIAVAAAPQEGELTLTEWAKAMRDLGLLPSLGRVFKLSFLGEPSSRAYMVAGAFVDFLRREHGMAAVRSWYHGDSLERATGASLSELEAAFLKSLDAIVIPPNVLEVARARFDQPAIFARACPHIVDRIEGEAGTALAELDTDKARKLYGDVLRLDPHEVGARLALATCSERDGKMADAAKLLSQVAADPSLGKAVRARVEETLGDVALQSGNRAEATKRYDEAATLVVDTDRLRTLDVKRFAAKGGGAGIIEEHLLGDPRRGRSPTRVASLLGAWSAREPREGLPDYLLARIYVGEGRYDLAAVSLEQALSRDLPIPSVLREAYRLRVVVACALGDGDAARVAHAAWSKQPGIALPERDDMGAFLERCTGAAPGTPVSASGGSTFTPAPTPATPSAVPPRPSAVSPVTAPPPSGARCPDNMVEIPASETWIGSPRGQGVDDEWPRYRTKLADYCIDRTEVTVSAYAACVASGKCTPARADYVICTAKHHGDSYPINCVNWNQATAYCASVGARLPTEAEWEHAASGGDDREYSWGSEPPDDRTCWKEGGACPVAAYAAGAFGLFDMTGNVWEWTSDGYGDYPYPPLDSPSKVYRGGSWSRRFEKWMRVRLRNRAAPSFQGAHLGFRCAKTALSAECPFGRGGAGECLHGVLDADCRDDKRWNGQRCARGSEPGCGEGHHFVPGHGCQFDEEIEEGDAPPLDLAAVHRGRSPEFDADCTKFQAARPHAYRFDGGTHDARTAVARSEGCKNRDVGVGWNSCCCPD